MILGLGETAGMEPMLDQSSGFPLSDKYQAFKTLRAGLVDRARRSSRTHPTRLSLDSRLNVELRPVFLALGIEDKRYEVRACLMTARPLDEI
jgi:hypothetical protein